MKQVSCRQTIPECILCREQGLSLYRALSDQLYSTPGNWDLLACPNCDHVWMAEIPAREQISDLYEGYYTHTPLKETYLRRLLKRGIPVAVLGFEDDGLSSVTRWLAHLLGLIGPLREFANSVTMGLTGCPAARILDVGCGAGEFLKLMQYFGWDAHGTDVDPVALAAARENLKTDTVYCGSLPELDLQRESYDAITMAHVIEHLDEPVAELQACHALLRNQGILSIMTPNSGSLGARTFKQDWRGFEIPRHFHVYNSQGLHRLLEANGFIVRSISSPTSIAPFMWTSSHKIRYARQKRAVTRGQLARDTCCGILFWFYEYIRNKFVGCGEELLVIAEKKQTKC